MQIIKRWLFEQIWLAVILFCMFSLVFGDGKILFYLGLTFFIVLLWNIICFVVGYLEVRHYEKNA